MKVVTGPRAHPVGFVIASHREPMQLVRLVRTLNNLYGEPPIICHHDFGQCPLDVSIFPRNIRFVEPHVATSWAKWSVVEGVLRAIRLLYKTAAPNWFVVLSAADYPLSPADEILQDFNTREFDAYIDFRRVGASESEASSLGPRNPQLWQSETAKGRQLGYQRYLASNFWVPTLRRKPSGNLRLGKISLELPFQSLSSPFRGGYVAYHGDFWFSGNHRTAEVLLNPSTRDKQAAAYLKYRTFPEEAYFQTVICNRSELNPSRDNKRFALWFEGSNHPAELGSQHLELMHRSTAHFARKFKTGDPVLDALDKKLGLVIKTDERPGDGI